MVRFSKIGCSVVMMVAVLFTTNLTILLGQTNDDPVSEETKPHDDASEVGPVVEVELQTDDPISRRATVNPDSATTVEVQRLFNELRKEYLDARAKSIDWWLEFIAIVLAFFAVAIAIIGYIGFREFRRLRDEADKQVKESQRLRDEARQNVDEIRKDKAESDELVQNMRQKGNAEVFDLLSGNEGFAEILRDLLQDPELSVIDKAIADASALQQAGAVTDAIEKWRSIANIVEGTDTDLATRAWFSVGYLHSQQNEPEEAIPAYDRAIYLKSDYAEAYNNRGAANGKLGQYDAAITDLDKAIALDPNDAEAYYNRGIVQFNRGNYDDAFTDFDQAIRLKPSHIGAHINRGSSRAILGQYDAAITDLDKAITLDPNDAEAYYNRGIVKFLLGAHSAAPADFDELLHFEEARSDLQTSFELAEQQGLADLKIAAEKQLNELDDIE